MFSDNDNLKKTVEEPREPVTDDVRDSYFHTVFDNPFMTDIISELIGDDEDSAGVYKLWGSGGKPETAGLSFFDHLLESGEKPGTAGLSFFDRDT